jgi:hypothetical protein
MDKEKRRADWDRKPNRRFGYDFDGNGIEYDDGVKILRISSDAE